MKKAFWLLGLALLLSGCIKQRHAIVDLPPPPDHSALGTR